MLREVWTDPEFVAKPLFAEVETELTALAQNKDKTNKIVRQLTLPYQRGPAADHPTQLRLHHFRLSRP